MNKRKQVAIMVALLGRLGHYRGNVLDHGGPARRGCGRRGAQSPAMASADEPRPVTLDAESARRIGVTYATATIRPFDRSVSTVGNITYDETRLANMNPKIEGCGDGGNGWRD